MSVLFLSEKSLKAHSYLSDNLDMKTVTPVLITTQELYLKPLLGSVLYDDLCAQIEADTISDAYNTLLIDYIRPCLIWQLLVQGNQLISLNLMTGLNLQDTARLLDKLRHYAFRYGRRLSRFLEAHPALYPKYHAAVTGKDQLPPITPAPYSGLNL